MIRADIYVHAYPRIAPPLREKKRLELDAPGSTVGQGDPRRRGERFVVVVAVVVVAAVASRALRLLVRRRVPAPNSQYLDSHFVLSS